MSENGWEREVLEKLMLQTLKEQRARRRWGIFFKLTTIILVIFVIFSIKSLSFSSKETVPVQKHTAMVEIRGTIDSSGNSSAANIIKALDKAYAAAEKISFEGVHYRRDIGQRALKAMQ